MIREKAPAQEILVATAFDKQSTVFDQIYSGNSIIRYKRARVRNLADGLLNPESVILELNAGTGEDALYFARQGHRVHATDISAGMQEKLIAKAAHMGLSHKITTENCSFTALDSLRSRGPYDMILSNFAGLNCTGDLDKVLDSLGSLVKPGGFVVLVMLPKFCLWESLLFLKGKWKTAFRRFSGNKGVSAHIEGIHFTCWYYNPSFIIRRLKKSFTLHKLEGLCTIVPPSYIEGFGEKYPGLFRFLQKAENRLKSSWPWSRIGDYYIVSLRMKG